MQAIYEDLATEWYKFCKDPVVYEQRLCESTLKLCPDPRLAAVLENDPRKAKLFYHHATIVAYNTDTLVWRACDNCKHSKVQFAVPNFEDVFVGLLSGESDADTAFEVTVNGHKWGESILLPGKPTLALRGTHVLPVLALPSSLVQIRFTGPVPKTLHYIGGRVGDHEQRQLLQQQLALKYCFENGEVAFAENGCAQRPQLHMDTELPVNAFTVPVFNACTKK